MQSSFFTHIRRIFTHVRCTKRLHIIDCEKLPEHPVVPLCEPILITCSSAPVLWKCAKCAGRPRGKTRSSYLSGGNGATRQRLLAQNFRYVRTGRAQEQAILLAFDLQFWIDRDYSAERFDGFRSKARAALRSVGVARPEATAERLPGNQRGPRQVAHPARRPGVEIERQWRPLDSPDGP